MSGVPDSEMEVLLRDAADAVNLAVVGEAGAGVKLLAGGLHRVQTMLGTEHGSEALVDCYRRTLHEYCRQYGVPPLTLPDGPVEACRS